MIDKRVASAAEAVSQTFFDGAAIMIGGFGEAGSPIELIHALIDQGATDLTMISNNCGERRGRPRGAAQGGPRFPKLLLLVSAHRQLDRLPRALPKRAHEIGNWFLREHSRSASALAELESRRSTRRPRWERHRRKARNAGNSAEESICLSTASARTSPITGRVADTHGNILYSKTGKRNFGPPMAMRARSRSTRSRRGRRAGQAGPRVDRHARHLRDRVVAIANSAHESELVEAGAS